MAPSSSKIAAPAKYSLDSSSWKKVDHFFASFWCHEDVTSLLLFIQDYDVTRDNWPRDKTEVRDAIDLALPVLQLLCEHFPPDKANQLDPLLLDLWYGYTRLLALMGTGPEEWKAVCVPGFHKPSPLPKNFYFPTFKPIKINGDLDVFSGTGMFNMPQDVLAREASPEFVVIVPKSTRQTTPAAKATTKTAPKPIVKPPPSTPVASPSSSRLPKRDFRELEASPTIRPKAERSTRIAAATPSIPPAKRRHIESSSGKVEVVVESPPTKSKPQTRSSTSRRQTQPPAKSSVPKSVTIIDGEPSDEESAPAGSEVGDGEEDADGDVEMTPAVTTRATKKKGKGKGKKAKPTPMRDTDASTIPEVIGELLSQRQGNPAEFNVVPEGLRIIGTVRLPTTANPVYYNGMPAANTGKRYHLHEDRVDGNKLQLEELESITDEVNYCLPRIACMNCLAAGKKCTPVAF
ncbi:hypothetical protein B0H12DRAFT_1245903, partial [Mycena haematopus]